MTDPILLRTDQGAVTTLTLNAPHSFNALSGAMLAALTGELARLASDTSIRVIIIQAAGRAFCAGHDLKEIQAARAAPDKGAAHFADLFSRCSALMQSLRAQPQPVIASVHGIATAAGCQMVASCDLAVAATGTRFGVNGVNIGLFCSTPMVALSRKVPAAIAFELLVTGEFIDADRAREIGLVNRVVPAGQLIETTRNLADTIAAKLTATVRVGKQAFYRQAEMGLAEAYAYTGAVIVENLLQPDTDEGISAFLEKRPPNWP